MKKGLEGHLPGDYSVVQQQGNQENKGASQTKASKARNVGCKREDTVRIKSTDSKLVNLRVSSTQNNTDSNQSRYSVWNTDFQVTILF